MRYFQTFVSIRAFCIDFLRNVATPRNAMWQIGRISNSVFFHFSISLPLSLHDKSRNYTWSRVISYFIRAITRRNWVVNTFPFQQSAFGLHWISTSSSKHSWINLLELPNKCCAELSGKLANSATCVQIFSDFPLNFPDSELVFIHLKQFGCKLKRSW